MSARTDMAALGELAEDQYGLVTSVQAAEVGVSHVALSRLAGDGVLDRVSHGIYRVRGGAEHRASSLYAAWLALDPATPGWRRAAPVSGVVSHRSAARFYDLGDLTADVSEFLLATRRQTRRQDLRLHRGKVGNGEWEWVDGLPVTRPARIVTDLLIERTDPSAVATIAADALRLRHTTEDELVAALTTLGRRFRLDGLGGPALLRRFLETAATDHVNR
jgi:predicted transcriptional regulator of viral defense system